MLNSLISYKTEKIAKIYKKDPIVDSDEQGFIFYNTYAY